MTVAPAAAIPTPTPVAVPFAAFDALATLQQLGLEAGTSENPRQLYFRMLNRSAAYCPYDRAALWRLDGRPRLLGVSGSTDLNANAPLVAQWRMLVGRLPHPERVLVVDERTVPHTADVWSDLVRRHGGLSVLWLPVLVAGKPVAGLWLERWGGRPFGEHERRQLEALGLAYGVAWRSVLPRPGPVRRWLGRWRARMALGIVALVLAALVFVPVPLRIVASCEVVPQDPAAITAPLAGVIDEILVLPGRTVEAGALLAVYDKRVALEELRVAEQQVQIVESDLQRARVQAFDQRDARATIALLENRLEQEKTRLRIARYRAERLEIRAPVAGTLMFDDPHTWRGRPVQVGERLMLIVDPQRTKVRAWLPPHDNIDFDPQRPVSVILDADPRTARPAQLLFVANHSQRSPDGASRFRAEATWTGTSADLKPGQQGSAVLYGPDVSLGYWLVRRPLAAVRQWLGV